MEKVYKKYFTESGVLFETSDKVIFLERHFAQAHADKNGLTIKEIYKPKKRVKNGNK